MYPGAHKAVAYDKVATMFSPDGRLYQVEYASKIVAQGTLGVGLVFEDGVLLGADKRVASRLMKSDSIEKLFKIDSHIGAVSSGLVGDARQLVSIARQASQNNVMVYDEAIHVETLVKEIAAIKHQFTQYGGARPFGVSLILAGVDDTGFRLFETEPSGALAEYSAIAIGNKKKEAMAILEKGFRDNLSLEEGASLLVDTIKATYDEKAKIDISKIDVAFIDSKRKFNHVKPEKLKAILSKKK
ncbi:MAG TPA: archaeal proteasome endopeptidase complex subunit alpha [archaeon]|nr:archaeal proteasome endopeptidase complex subunit alpha [archaeon]